MGLLDLFAALGDDLLADSAKPKKAADRRAGTAAERSSVTAPTLPPKPRAPTTWQPLCVVVWQAKWRCRCGACGLDAPIIMLREEHGARDSKFYQQRLRRIESLSAYPLLPVDAEIADPQIVDTCAACVTPVLRNPQLTLQLDAEPIAPLYRITPLEKLYDDYAEMRIAAASTRALSA